MQVTVCGARVEKLMMHKLQHVHAQLGPMAQQMQAHLAPLAQEAHTHLAAMMQQVQALIKHHIS